MNSTETLVKAMEQRVSLSDDIRAAFLAVPRHLFVQKYYEHRGKEWVVQDAHPEVVYQDRALVTQVSGGMPISSSSQPSIMAAMLEALTLAPGQRVLEIGVGTSYNAALMGHLVDEYGRVTSVDIEEKLISSALINLRRAGFDQVDALCADGMQGYREAAPYDRIIATAGFRHVPRAWREQLVPGGILVGNLLGNLLHNGLVRFIKQADGSLHGSFLSSSGFFMELRNPSLTYMPLPFNWEPYDVLPATTYTTKLNLPALLNDQAFLCYLQLRLPQVQLQVRPTGGPVVQRSSYERWLVHKETRASLVIPTEEEQGEWRVKARGSLWAEVEYVCHQWQQLGMPELSAFQLKVTSGVHVAKLEEEHWIF